MQELYGRYEFIEAKTITEAAALAPWASILFEVQGGYRAYEKVSDFLDWCATW